MRALAFTLGAVDAADLPERPGAANLTAPNIAVAGVERNVELKARDRSDGGALARALAAGALDEGILWQRDSYFHVPSGGLKLREQRPGGAELIYHERPDTASARTSAYSRALVADVDAILSLF